ncbi:hypothetical protein NQZ79_g1023 [Umbelopsis isabellina]|nr:hypothetical protein NQZ79_g1023 [Umbelopsis isabellina]
MKTVSAKSVRKKLESINNCSYSDQKKQIDALIMEVYQSLQSDEESSEDEPLARPKSSNKESGSQKASKSAEYDAYVVKPSESKRKASTKDKEKKDKPAKKRKTKTPSETSRGAPNNGFNKPLKISPAIQVLTRSSEEELPRPQIVKRIWAYIKEKDLQDPNDKREILCDDVMKSVFKTDRVHMFTMNKLLNEELKAIADDDRS